MLSHEPESSKTWSTAQAMWSIASIMLVGLSLWISSYPRDVFSYPTWVVLPKLMIFSWIFCSFSTPTRGLTKTLAILDVILRTAQFTMGTVLLSATLFKTDWYPSFQTYRLQITIILGIVTLSIWIWTWRRIWKMKSESTAMIN